MNDVSGTKAKKRSKLRWITLGEAIAIAALILSGLGLWHEWNKPAEKPAAEAPRAIALALRGRVTNDGRDIEIAPVEASHALQSLTVALAGKKIEVGSSGRLSADDFEDLVAKGPSEAEGLREGTVNITARYVEAGADKTATGSYRVRYRWEGGGIFGGRRIRFEDFSR